MRLRTNRRKLSVFLNVRRGRRIGTTAHRMEENTQVHEHHMEEIEAKKNADIEKMEKRAELRKERDAAKANQPLVDLHLNSIPESYHEALKNGIVHVSRERTLGFSWLREGYDTGPWSVRPTVENQYSSCRLLWLWREVVVM